MESDWSIREIGKYTKDGIQLFRPANLGELAGHYFSEISDSVFVLKTEMKEGILTWKLFAAQGLSPQVEKLLQLADFQNITSFEFDCSLEEMSFYSLVGSGEIIWKTGQIQLKFDYFKGRKKELVFVKQ